MYTDYNMHELDGIFADIFKGAKGLVKGGVKVGKKIFKGGKKIGQLEQAAYTGPVGVALTPQEAAFQQQYLLQQLARGQSFAPPSATPNWLIPAAIGGAALLVVLTMSKK